MERDSMKCMDIFSFLICWPQILHCDLKAANILLDKDHQHCKLTDFGLSIIKEGSPCLTVCNVTQIKCVYVLVLYMFLRACACVPASDFVSTVRGVCLRARVCMGVFACACIYVHVGCVCMPVRMCMCMRTCTCVLAHGMRTSLYLFF